MEELKFKYGQVLVANQDVEVVSIDGEKDVIKKGSKAVVGFDRNMRHYNGYTQGFSDDIKIEGISPAGMAEYIADYLKARFPLREMLEDFDLNEREFEQAIFEAFEEIGLFEDEN